MSTSHAPKIRIATTYPQLALFAGDTPNTIVNRFACPRCACIGEQAQTSNVRQKLLTIQMLTQLYLTVQFNCAHCGNTYDVVLIEQHHYDGDMTDQDRD